MAKNLAHDPNQNYEFFFRGGGSVLKPNYMTRYLYPSLLGYPLGCLRLELPSIPSSRSRPQGYGSWGTDGHTFLTISKSWKPALSLQLFMKWSTEELGKDEASANPLGRAMARISQYQGNTVVEAGKSQLKKGEAMCYVVVRKSAIVLEGGKECGSEEERYVIKCGKWRSLEPPSTPGHDSWWMRLHSLFQGSYERAFFHARDQIDNVLNIPPPIIKWYPRPDIEAHATIYANLPPPSQAKFMGDACPVCSRTWFTESEHACRLKCGHFLCLECLTQHVDSSGGRGKIDSTEIDPNTKFFRCMECKAISPITTNRADITRPDELAWWRWKICMRRLEKEMTEFWLVRLQTLPHSRWFRDIPEDWDFDQQVKEIKVYVSYENAVKFMEVPRKVWAMLPYGFSLDNPVGSTEALALEECLRQELKRLSVSRRLFNTKEMVDHLAKVGQSALRPVIVEDVSARLGNPSFPPGYGAYRKFLCEWTASGVFECPLGRVDILEFMRRMERNKDRTWWKEQRDVFFDP